MKKHFLFFIVAFFFAISAFGQGNSNPKIEKTKFYFYTIFYGFKKDVYISEIYDLDIGRNDVFKESKNRYENVKQFLMSNLGSSKIQSGYEKNYYQRNQAENERDYIMNQLKNQEYKIISFKYK
ncbi:hypothetical protein [Faecalibacter sp. LW9]|uniref:hypothetical protein n=1 Tax=Faecalibacter sp. LW9 TaxID=3103144 RepID=UPI002AFE5980|nr:hypothetical protein [Faecalibacter sp. LW9]